MLFFEAFKDFKYEGQCPDYKLENIRKYRENKGDGLRAH